LRLYTLEWEYCIVMEHNLRLNELLFSSPIGWILLRANNGFITKIIFVEDAQVDIEKKRLSRQNNEPETNTDKLALGECYAQLDLYFKGRLKAFDIKYQNNGTDFQQKVWGALQKIDYGTTTSYGRLAALIGQKKAVRAVGGAMNKNNLLILTPCHRVIGSNGSLTGYDGGLWRKEWLLNHEKKYA